MVDRRAAMRLGLGGAWMAAGASIGVAAAAGAAVRRQLPFGAAVRAEQIYGNADFAAAVIADCDIVTPEIELNWDKVEAAEGNLNFYQADQVADFCTRHGKRMGGHILLWHLSIPAWAKASLGQPGGWDLVRRYLSSVMPRYGAVTDHWEVVNEPLAMGFREDGLRPSPFLQAFGPDYIQRGFHDARLFAPKAKLSLNEFGLTYTYKEERDKRYHLLRLLERLRKANAPIDGVGLQSHLDLAKQDAFDPKVVADFIAEIAGMGLEIRVTELDVKEYDYMASVETRDARVADAVQRYLDVVLASPAVTQVCCWGLSDRYSWLKVEPADLARGHWAEGAGPGLNRGLPLDSDMRPKAFWRVIKTALNR